VKSLLDLQQELRTLEKDVTDVMKSVQSINHDIEQMRNTSSSDIKVDYKKIELLAENISFEDHPLSEVNDEKVCKIYLEMLLNITRLDLDEKNLIERLVFIQWLQKESKIDWILEELFQDCLKTKEEFVYEFVELLPIEYVENFIVDALIVAGLCGGANAEIYEYIANLVAILGIKKEKLVELSIVVRVVLCQDTNWMSKEEEKIFLKYIAFFEYYTESENIIMSKNIIKGMRQIVVKMEGSENERDTMAMYRQMFGSENKIIHWEVENGQKVNKGDVIATYRNYSDLKIESIKAPLSGTLYQFKFNASQVSRGHRYYGVISHKKDNPKSIETWLKEKNGEIWIRK
jgi:hypothetical protein